MKFLLSLFILFSFYSFSQHEFSVFDSETKKTIPFVKVQPEDGKPFLSDIDGRFEINENISSFTLSYAGYSDTIILVQDIKGYKIYLHYPVQQIEEVFAMAGENPAHKIVKKAIKNRKKNHPLKNDAFTYTAYEKFWFDIQPDSGFYNKTPTEDTSSLKFKEFIESQHLFLLETASKRTFSPPNYDKEEIIAYKISGTENPMLSTLAKNMQSFSFYENEFGLLGKNYLTPLAPGSLGRYFYNIEDTIINQGDTTFVIFYRPLKSKHFNGINGRMYINTNGYAIEKVIAKPAGEAGGFDIEIVQEYAFIEEKKWFPIKLSTKIIFGESGSLILEGGNLVGQGSTYIKSIHFPEEKIKKRHNDNISVYTDNNAVSESDVIWDSIRQYALSDKDERTYEMIDSLSEAENLDRSLNILSTLIEGKIPLGYINLNLAQIATFNYYEGFRLGAGLETSQKLMKPIVVGGYFAYGTRDFDWKFGGKTTFHLNKRKGLKIELKYHQDVIERGGLTFTKDAFDFNNQNGYRDFFIHNMDKQRLGELSIYYDLKSNITFRLFGNYQRIWLTDDYSFSPNNSTIYTPEKDFDLAETGIEFQWDFFEKNMMLDDRKVSLGTKYPRLKVIAVKGWKNVEESNYDYIRLKAEVSQKIKVIGLGDFHWKIEGATTIGDVPLLLNHVGNGTNVEWNLNVYQSFQTMIPSEFYSTSQAALFTHFTFRPIHTNATWNEPRITLHHAIGYGEFSRKEQHSVPFKTMDKGFYEGGLILDGLLTSSFSSIGIGVFYRYGEYSNAISSKNIVPKISVAINIE